MAAMPTAAHVSTQSLPQSVVPIRRGLARGRDVAWPREHGSWSFTLEPLALGVIAALSRAGACLAVPCLAVLGARTMFLLVWPRPVWRARTLGMIEPVLGAGFVLTVAWAWRA